MSEPWAEGFLIKHIKAVATLLYGKRQVKYLVTAAKKQFVDIAIVANVELCRMVTVDTAIARANKKPTSKSIKLRRLKNGILPNKHDVDRVKICDRAKRGLRLCRERSIKSKQKANKPIAYKRPFPLTLLKYVVNNFLSKGRRKLINDKYRRNDKVYKKYWLALYKCIFEFIIAEIQTTFDQKITLYNSKSGTKSAAKKSAKTTKKILKIKFVPKKLTKGSGIQILGGFGYDDCYETIDAEDSQFL